MCADAYFIVRKIKLTGGNLVLDNPVPNKYLERLPIKEGHEFTHMRYTAATCDPAEFQNEKYQLRQQMMGRETELFIVLTMYNVRRRPLFCSHVALTFSGIGRRGLVLPHLAWCHEEYCSLVFSHSFQDMG